jgi:molybdenum cofactor biosynthesis protein B
LKFRSYRFDVRIDGFGELFRLISFESVGSRAMLSRAAAGVVSGTPVFLLPGSPDAVSLALTRLVLPEIGHVVGELRRHGPRR